ncbi:unnamed protein product [Trifolium pratense]|uniref:Uncharacterized protein n=1 Tax=Trifolium pratense TaxID=57577 RepID=A0ACB0IEA2_TRIPR|nr:unnamed protein product [Trifolium pratense]
MTKICLISKLAIAAVLNNPCTFAIVVITITIGVCLFSEFLGVICLPGQSPHLEQKRHNRCLDLEPGSTASLMNARYLFPNQYDC